MSDSSGPLRLDPYSPAEMAQLFREHPEDPVRTDALDADIIAPLRHFAEGARQGFRRNRCRVDELSNQVCENLISRGETLWCIRS